MNSYNPFASALTAAAVELTSPAAKRYYVNRAQADIQTVIILIVGFGCMAYVLGAQSRAWCDAEGAWGKLPPGHFLEIEQSTTIAVIPVVISALVKVAPSSIVTPVVPVRVVAIASVAPRTLPAAPAPIALLSAGKVKNRKSTAPKTPASKSPKGRSSAGIAPRKAPTTIRSSTGALIPID